MMSEDYFDESEQSGVVFEPQLPPWYEPEGEKYPDALTLSDLEKITDAAFARLENVFENYQVRDSQLKMARRILKALYNSRTGVYEAGTGVGKSFAYLIAAYAFSFLKGERVLVSTDTRNLQMQLVDKDLPVINEALGGDCSYSLCLGSGNYLCRVRFEEVELEGRFLDVLSEDEFRSFSEWSRTVFQSETAEGRYSDLNVSVPYSFWGSVGRDPEGCPGNRCMYFSSCNYYRARNNWSHSRVLVANHHLTLFHMLNEKKTLPAYEAVIFDEAHGFVKTGYSIYTQSFSSEAVSEQRKKFNRAVKEASLPPEKITEFEEHWATMQNSWQQLCTAWEVETDLSFADDKTAIISSEGPPAGDAEKAASDLHGELAKVIENEEDTAALNQLNSLLKWAAAFKDFLKRFQKFDFESNVYWARKREPQFSLFVCNLNLGEEISEMLTETAVFTSATIGYWSRNYFPARKSELLEAGYFNHFVEQVIPDTGRVDSDIFFSPFSYRDHSVIYIPRDLKVPAFGASDDERNRYEEMLLEEIIRLTSLSQGGALVLFTSNYLLRKTTEAARELTDLPIHSQIESGADKALEAFRADANSILFGTTSFWQGVDVTGRGLRMLIITRLMFSPPDDPIYKGRADRLEKAGENSFYRLSLPSASMMLRQAFGRLIRSESDKGVVALLDSRIVEKNYGKLLVANLPRTDIVFNSDELEKMIAEKELLQ